MNNIFKEYDVVYAKVNINENIKVGTKGVILMIFEDNITHYEIEFVDNDNNTIDVLTVEEFNITY